MGIIEKAIDRLNAQSGGMSSAPLAGAQEALRSESVANDTFKTRVEEEPGRATDTSKNSRLHLSAETFSTAGIATTNGVLPYVADEYRRIKRPVLANAFGNESQLTKNGNLVLVTSSLPGEGKSFTAINLALSIAMERDRTVLLVDADVTKSTTSKMVGLEQHAGLTEALLNENADLADVIVRTDFPCLSIIPSGRRHSHTAELLASNRMGEILQELATRYPNRIILFDAPPILVTPETQILCDRMGQIIFVVEMGVTPRNIVSQALALLPNDEKPVGLVLNKARKLSGSKDYGGYGYGD